MGRQKIVSTEQCILVQLEETHLSGLFHFYGNKHRDFEQAGQMTKLDEMRQTRR